MSMTKMLYELINMSDTYTFYADSIELAGVCACLLGNGYGAKRADGEGETTPVLFGWNEWLADRGVDQAWVDSHRIEIADAYDSFLIGSASQRADIDEAVAAMPEEKRKEFILKRQNKRRSSMNQIGEYAYELAEFFREKEKSAS